MVAIVQVLPGSTGERLGLRAGDGIVSVNGEEINDVIDFQFLAAEERITLVVQKKEGVRKKLHIQKDIDDTLGIQFPPLDIKRCRNKCIFCFVDQMPDGCRKSLYVKDDDYRASFLYGNFITLNSLSESDWDRIFRQRLSPLYISVHTTDPALRASMLRNKTAPPILQTLKRFADNGIRMHTQIVLCPEVNDGEHLIRTISDLETLFPAVSSIAVVPVGVTGFRKNLFSLRTFSAKEARRVVETVTAFGDAFKKKHGTRLVFVSDEFYMKANIPVPGMSFYEEFPQIENGVGMVSTFLGEVSRTRLPLKMRPLSATLVTGASFSRLLKPVLARLETVRGLSIKAVVVRNRFFGPSVTVAGLLTGGDILHALRRKRLGEMVLVPSNALKEDETLFLDGMTLESLQQQLHVSVVPVDGFRHMVSILTKRGKEKG